MAAAAETMVMTAMTAITIAVRSRMSSSLPVDSRSKLGFVAKPEPRRDLDPLARRAAAGRLRVIGRLGDHLMDCSL